MKLLALMLFTFGAALVALSIAIAGSPSGGLGLLRVGGLSGALGGICLAAAMLLRGDDGGL